MRASSASGRRMTRTTWSPRAACCTSTGRRSTAATPGSTSTRSGRCRTRTCSRFTTTSRASRRRPRTTPKRRSLRRRQGKREAVDHRGVRVPAAAGRRRLRPTPRPTAATGSGTSTRSNAVRAAGVPSAGVAFWNLGSEVAGGSHDVNPSTPATWAAVVDNAPAPGFPVYLGGGFEGRWAPDGSLIAFIHDAGQSRSIEVTSSDGSVAGRSCRRLPSQTASWIGRPTAVAWRLTSRGRVATSRMRASSMPTARARRSDRR